MSWINRDFGKEAEEEFREQEYRKFLDFIRGQSISPQELPDEAVDQWLQSSGELLGTFDTSEEDTPEKRRAKLEDLHRRWKELKQK